jgi:hypothetical protein
MPLKQPFRLVGNRGLFTIKKTNIAHSSCKAVRRPQHTARRHSTISIIHYLQQNP